MAAARSLALVGLGWLSACVTTYEDIPAGGDGVAPAVPLTAVTIPFAGGGDVDAGLLRSVYHGVVQRLSAAAAERDFEQVQALVQGYDRPGLPADLAAQLAGFRAVALGLRFQDHAQRHASLRLVAGDGGAGAVPPLGEPLTLELRLPATEVPVRLGGDTDAIGFAVSIVVDDSFVDGATHSMRTQDFVWLPTRFELAGQGALTLPIAVDLPVDAAIGRAILVRVDLMPGYVDFDGVRAPLQRTSIGAISIDQRPAGFEALKQNPLAELRQALASFGPLTFARAHLAAILTTGDEREEAMRLLIEQVRFGRPDAAQVAMAALRTLGEVQLPLGDREAWLAWWGRRR